MSDGSIHVSNAESQEALVFNKLHLDKFFITHARSDTETPLVLRGICGFFEKDSSGKKIYARSNCRLETNDLYGLVFSEYMNAKQKTWAETQAMVVSAKTELGTKYATGEYCDIHLMVAFELAIARLVEMLTGKDVIGV